MSIHYDDSRSPLIIFTWRGTISDADVESFTEKMIATLARQQRFAVLVDTRDSDRPTPKQRQRLAKWANDHASASKQFNVGVSFVIDKAIIRGALTAILWLAPMPMAHSVCAKFDDAEAWLIERLAGAGLRVPPRKAVG